MENQNGNFILKQLMITTAKKEKRALVRELKVDIQNCNPLVINELTYNDYLKRKFTDTILLFLDKEYRLMSIIENNQLNFFNSNLINEKYKTDFPNLIESYFKNYHVILAITPPMRTFNPNSIINEYNDTSINERLKKYKYDKYAEVSDISIQFYCNQIYMTLNEFLFSDEFKNIAYPKKISLTNKEARYLMSRLLHNSYEYIENKKNYEKFETEYYKEKIFDAKLNIIKLNDLLCS